MSEDIDAIQLKRQAALDALRKRRGETRQPVFGSRIELEKDRLSLIVKTYKSLSGATPGSPEDADEEDGETLLPPHDDGPDLAAAGHPDVPLLETAAKAPAEPPAAEEPAAELPRVAKSRAEVARRDEKARSAVEKWRTMMKRRRERQLAPGDAPPAANPVPPEQRRQMFFDLLTVDFLENSRVWISADPNAIDLSSTSREEVQRLHDHAVYRRRVLEELGKMNEQELDAITSYLRTVPPDTKPAA